MVYCIAQFEMLTASLYERAARAVSDKSASISLILHLISMESRTHSHIMGELARRLGLRETSYNCKDIIGEPWRRIETLVSNLDFGEGASLSQLLKELEFVEGFVGEETYTKVVLPLLKDMLSDRGVDLVEVANIVIDKIVQDEKCHERLVARVREYVEKSSFKKESP